MNLIQTINKKTQMSLFKYITIFYIFIYKSIIIKYKNLIDEYYIFFEKYL